MKTPLIFASLLIMATSSLFSSSVEVGISEAQLLEQKELAKAGKVSVGSKTIYNWPDMEVWVVSGKVTKVEKHAVKSQAEIDKAHKATQELQLERQKKIEEQSAEIKKRQAELNAAEIDRKKKAEAEKTSEENNIFKYGSDKRDRSHIETHKPKTSLATGTGDDEKRDRSQIETQKIETSPVSGIVVDPYED